MKRIALFMPGLKGGGAENVFVILANYWVSTGIHVDLLVFDESGPMLERLDSKVERHLISTGRSKIWRRFSIAKSVAAYCRREKPVLLLSTLTYCNITAVMAKALYGVGETAVVIREANSLDNVRKAGKWGTQFIFLLMRLLYPRATAVTANSDNTIRQMVDTLGVPRQNCHLVRNPVPAREVVDRRNVKTPMILGCGRLIPQKDFQSLIRAFARVREEIDCRLVILGEGEERAKLEALARELGLSEDRFELPGFVSNPGEFYESASVFVLSSRWEGLPNVVLEALSYGVPVVATDCSGGTAEIFKGVEERFLAEVGDCAGISNRIIHLLKNPPRPEQMQALIEQGYETGSVAESYLAFANKE